MKKLFISLIASLIFSASAYADCNYNGQNYPTGTRIGSLVCQPDGSWKP